MKVKFFNAARRHGTGKNGKDFDFTQMEAVVPLEKVANAKFNQSGHGFDTKQIGMRPDVLEQCAGLKLGQEVEIVLEPREDNPERNWITAVQA